MEKTSSTTNREKLDRLASQFMNARKEIQDLQQSELKEVCTEQLLKLEDGIGLLMGDLAIVMGWAKVYELENA